MQRLCAASKLLELGTPHLHLCSCSSIRCLVSAPQQWLLCTTFGILAVGPLFYPLLLRLTSSSYRTAKATKTSVIPGLGVDSSTKGDVIRWSQDGDLLAQIGDISRQETGERRSKKVELESAA